MSPTRNQVRSTHGSPEFNRDKFNASQSVSALAGWDFRRHSSCVQRDGEDCEQVGRKSSHPGGPANQRRLTLTACNGKSRGVSSRRLPGTRQDKLSGSGVFFCHSQQLSRLRTELGQPMPRGKRLPTPYPPYPSPRKLLRHCVATRHVATAACPSGSRGLWVMADRSEAPATSRCRRCLC